ncbi:hypothetical protein [Polycladomyces subterraneus]|uniref:Uncharacterized protein n=1 Tax=Polycladomyces subterraneus TaxID=1016997 RepID=A0ABT8IMZ0_9BACL|nr:hypothetical protein [Polycladomyces subterraneus]MDN4594150.1 hypothetical protein [Polycladomyces subterraneus]
MDGRIHGTYFLLFAGAGAIVIDQLPNSIWLYLVVTTLGVITGAWVYWMIHEGGNENEK